MKLQYSWPFLYTVAITSQNKHAILCSLQGSSIVHTQEQYWCILCMVYVNREERDMLHKKLLASYKASWNKFTVIPTINRLSNE